jgi:hypothetical protein
MRMSAVPHAPAVSRLLHQRAPDGRRVFRDDVLEHYRVRGYKLHERVKVRGRSGSVHACDVVAQGPLGNLIVMLGDEHDIEGPELTSFRRSAKDIGAAPVLAMEQPDAAVRETARSLGVKLLDEQALADGEPLIATPPPAEVEDHPWPEQEVRIRQAQRGREAAAPAAGEGAASLWRNQRSTGRTPAGEAASEPFAWLRARDPADAGGPTGPHGAASARAAASPAPTTVSRPPAHARVGEGFVVRSAPVRPAPDSGAVQRLRPETDAASADAVYVWRPFAWHWVWGPALYGAVTALLLWFAWFLFVHNG